MNKREHLAFGLVLVLGLAGAGAAMGTVNPLVELVTPGAEADNVGTDRMSEEFKCLALNVYHEARGETDEGQLAVAAVTLNRVGHENFPDTICGVVKQGIAKRGCQFSWVCDRHSNEVRDKEAWSRAQLNAARAMLARSSDPTNDALYYHANYVRPGWGKKMEKSARIGTHIFYRERSGLR